MLGQDLIVHLHGVSKSQCYFAVCRKHTDDARLVKRSPDPNLGVQESSFKHVRENPEASCACQGEHNLQLLLKFRE